MNRQRFPHRDSLALDYVDTARLMILHEIWLCDGHVLFVVGDPDNGSYEWVIQHGAELEHSNCGYSIPFVALRDGLIAYWGSPEGEMPKSIKTAVRILSRVHIPGPFASSGSQS